MNDYRKAGGFGGNRSKPGFHKKSFGRPSFGQRPDFKRSDDRGERSEMFSASCSSCHQPCQVPFRPNGEKPVYCNDCFRGKQDSVAGGFHKREPFSHGFSKNNSAPSFGVKPAVQDKRIDDLKRQLEIMSAKLDALIQLVRKDAPAEVPARKEEKRSNPAQIMAALKKAGALPKKEEKKAIAAPAKAKAISAAKKPAEKIVAKKKATVKKK